MSDCPDRDGNPACSDPAGCDAAEPFPPPLDTEGLTEIVASAAQQAAKCTDPDACEPDHECDDPECTPIEGNFCGLPVSEEGVIGDPDETPPPTFAPHIHESLSVAKALARDLAGAPCDGGILLEGFNPTPVQLMAAVMASEIAGELVSSDTRKPDPITRDELRRALKARLRAILEIVDAQTRKDLGVAPQG